MIRDIMVIWPLVSSPKSATGNNLANTPESLTSVVWYTGRGHYPIKPVILGEKISNLGFFKWNFLHYLRLLNIQSQIGNRVYINPIHTFGPKSIGFSTWLLIFNRCDKIVKLVFSLSSDFVQVIWWNLSSWNLIYLTQIFSE